MISFMHETRGTRLTNHPAAAQFVLRLISVQAHIAREEARVTCWHNYLGLWQQLMQRVKPANMIGVGMRRENAHNRQTCLLRGLHNRFGATGKRGVDQRETVLFTNQVDVDEAIVGQLDKIISMSGEFHRIILSRGP